MSKKVASLMTYCPELNQKGDHCNISRLWQFKFLSKHACQNFVAIPNKENICPTIFLEWNGKS